MRRSLSIVSALAVLAYIVAGCASAPGETDGVPLDDSLVQCVEPRPQMCTREYRPVCATLADGKTETYSTGCTACSDSNVVGYRPGACE